MPAAPTLVEEAPAKVNLTLHVRGRRPDGYHDLDSLVVFAGPGDRLRLEPGPDLALALSGPRADLISKDGDNLVLRAARALAEEVPGLAWGRFHLDKILPVAAGIGGGSSDAAAALRLLARLNGLSRSDPRLMKAAVATGADVPVCLDPVPRRMSGIGDVLGPPLHLPDLPLVLVNPGCPVETADVFRTLGLSPGQALAGAPHPELSPASDPGSFVSLLAQGRNDLEPAALSLAPVIGTVLTALREQNGCRLARMSGSGATVLGLFAERADAHAAAERLRRDHPDWWVQAARPAGRETAAA